MAIPLPMEAMLGPDRVPSGQHVTEPAFKQALEEASGVAARRQRVLHADVERIAAAAGYEMADVRGPVRTAELTEVRRIARYLRAQEPPVSYPVIGRIINRDPTSAMKLLRPQLRPSRSEVA